MCAAKGQNFHDGPVRTAICCELADCFGDQWAQVMYMSLAPRQVAVIHSAKDFRLRNIALPAHSPTS